MQPINVAIIGQGRSGRDIHGQYFSSAKDKFNIVAVVDTIAARRERAVREYGCEAFADYRELLSRKDIDLVVNSTFSFQHPDVTIDLLNHGFNVLVEKPLASSVKQVDDMIAAAEKSGKLLAIFQQSRFAAYFQNVRRVIDSGKLGRIVQISIAFNGFARRWDWQTLQSYKGGNLLNTGPHPLDQALQLFGTDVMPRVWCKMDRANTFGDAEDYVKLVLSGDADRPVIDLEISSCDAYPLFTYKIHGTRGGLIGSQTHADWKYYLPEEAPEQKLIREPLAKADGTPNYCGEKLVWHEESWDLSQDSQEVYGTFANMTGAFYDMLYAHMREGGPLLVTPQQVRQQIAVIEEAHRQNPLSTLG